MFYFLSLVLFFTLKHQMFCSEMHRGVATTSWTFCKSTKPICFLPALSGWGLKLTTLLRKTICHTRVSKLIDVHKHLSDNKLNIGTILLTLNVIFALSIEINNICFSEYSLLYYHIVASVCCQLLHSSGVLSFPRCQLQLMIKVGTLHSDHCKSWGNFEKYHF